MKNYKHMPENLADIMVLFSVVVYDKENHNNLLCVN